MISYTMLTTQLTYREKACTCSLQTKVMKFEINKRPKMGLNRSPDIHCCHEQEYVLEDWVKTLANSVRTSLYLDLTY